MPDRKETRFSAVTIWDPSGPHHQKVMDITLKDGEILTIAPPSEGFAASCDHAGGYFSAGWVDMRAYLPDPGEEWKEDIDSICAAANRGGFAEVVCHTVAKPATDDANRINSLVARAREKEVKLSFAGTVSQDRSGKELAELFDMHRAGAVAFSDGLSPIDASGLVLRALKYVSGFDGLLMLLPLDSDLAARKQVGESPVSTRMGMQGVPAIAESTRLERDLQLIGYFNPNARVHFGPITTAAGVAILREAKKLFPNISADTSVLHLLKNDASIEAFDSRFKVWPPLRGEADRMALVEGVLDGTIDAISSGHHPQAKEDKVNDFASTEFGAATLETAFHLALVALGADNASLILERLIQGPSRILKRSVPEVSVGTVGAWTWMNPANSTHFSAGEFQSKAWNQPFQNTDLPGQIVGY